ncbi:hypothetical protein Q4Q39_14600 [Flavivirga amylovorans]|uniref:Peptidase S74 domain-containing protein n=1 Tax=Flavivirga amylovorans TaxID=870486 RepID=A0ABT8X3W4_9FLAO|nr:hypothetical protein [Flavivirga amylovorans]MDO5988639.1 hypothetical protein [Flavivirga amylovorans]
MKRIFTQLLFLLFILNVSAQTDGISYQAVIIGPDVLELPGVDSEGNYLPSTTVAIRFVIFDSGNEVEFEEVQVTTTDEFGRINLIIGAVEHDNFEKINWDGTAKDLAVEIDFEGGNNFVDMSREVLTFVPYAYHRNITATGTLDVDDDTFLNRELTVDGPTTLNSTLSVNGGNATTLTGDLTVDGTTNLNGTLDVNNQNTTNLSGALNVGVATGGFDALAPTLLNGTLDVIGKTTVADFEATGEASFANLEANTLKVNDTTRLFGMLEVDAIRQIKLRSSVSTGDITYNNATPSKVTGDDPGLSIDNYPVLVEGSNQGIAIKVIGNRRNGNNFVSFWDDGTDMMWGRIEGEIKSEYENNADYLFDQSSLEYDIYEAEIDRNFAIADAAIGALQVIKAATDFRGCLGIGGCLASPGPADIAFAAAEVISDGIQVGYAQDALNRARGYKVTYDQNKDEFVGVSYASGAGDYAEYLLREHINEEMTYGDIVGVTGGKISKNTINAERFMVVSYKPIVLGNMPQPSEEANYEKVAFMGQVPVKVFGKVNVGDYIIPSGNNDGIGKAVAPSKIAANQIKDIVGTAWTNSNNSLGFNLVNVAVGLNRNDNNIIVERLAQKVEAQAVEIQDLKKQITAIHEMLSNPGNANALVSKTSHEHQSHTEHETSTDDDHYDDRKYEIIDTDEGEIVYWEVTREDFEKGLKMAEEQMRIDGVDIENNFLWKKLKNDSAYKERLLTQLKSKLDNQFHYHKGVDKKGGH